MVTYALGIDIMEATSSESDDRGQLLQRIHELEERLSRYENFGQLLDEADSMMSRSVTCLHGSDTLSHLVLMVSSMSSRHMLHLFNQLGHSEHNQSANQSSLSVEEMKTVTSLCVHFSMQGHKSSRGSSSLRLVARGTGKQVTVSLVNGYIRLT